MTLKSALQDVRETTLAAVSGLLAKLGYLASLRRKDGSYQHWGVSLLHGEGSSDRALNTVHSEVLSSVLRAPLSTLVEDLRHSSEGSGQNAEGYIEKMRGEVDKLLPEQANPASASHLNSVLVALSNLEKAQERATRSTS